MTTLTKDEAIALLSRPLVCKDHDGWKPDKDLPNAYRFIGGLLFANGDRARLVLEIIVKISSQTQIKHFTFTIFQPRPYDARVYQLEVRNCPKALRDLHQWPHEHFGTEKTTCLEWRDWGYEAAFKHFQTQTGVALDPELFSPFELNLRSPS